MIERPYQRLKGKSAIVTGGGQGLGEALCVRLAEEGCRVAVADVNFDAAKKVADSLPDAIPVPCDVTRYEDCEKAAEAVTAKWGTIDILVSNAAILISGAVETMDPLAWKKVIDVNLCGFFNTVKACAPVFQKNRSGVIIQINSKSGKKGSFKNSAYAASKFGGIGLVQSLALEFAPHNVRVNAICPGNLLNSPLWTSGPNSLLKQYSRNQGISEEELLKKYLAQVPLGRTCEYEDVANVMVFLASDDASYMTGQAINVTGGQEMR
jgi:sorbitol-6-phosphate 2-dehydrogenase